MRRAVWQVTAAIFCLLLLIFTVPGTVSAEEAAPPPEEETAMAEDISHVRLVTDNNGFPSLFRLFDKELYLSEPADGPCHLTLEAQQGMGSLYMMFTTLYGEYQVTNGDTGVTKTCGKDGFLHEFIDLVELFGTVPKKVTLSFENTVTIRELYVFTEGQTPDFVQKWKHPEENNTDMILFSTHSDDEHLFFAGILPYYAGELGYQVQVVYFTDHHNLQQGTRNMEALNGLWSVGVDTYPVFGPFEDFLVKEKISEAYTILKNVYGWTDDDLVGFVVEQLRRFKPMVVVGHDFHGEYGHAQHMVYANMLAAAVEVSMDPVVYPETAEKYGIWDVPKTYFHLWPENPIVMDWDQPLERFGGETGYVVSTRWGFEKCHVSQIASFAWYYSYKWRATDIQVYSPREFGLYRTTVGPDVEKNDFFENVTIHAELNRIAEEKRLTEEKAAEAAAKKAAEEEAARKAAEEERLRQEAERAKLEAEQAGQLAKEAAQRKNQIIVAVSGGVLIAGILAGVILIKRKKK